MAGAGKRPAHGRVNDKGEREVLDDKAAPKKQRQRARGHQSDCR
jgi:hypothetical protein